MSNHTILEAVIWKSYVLKREDGYSKKLLVCVLVGSTVISKTPSTKCGLMLSEDGRRYGLSMGVYLKWL